MTTSSPEGYRAPAKGGNAMSESPPGSGGEGWWLANDGQWYPPERHPDYVQPTSLQVPATPSVTDTPPAYAPVSETSTFATSSSEVTRSEAAEGRQKRGTAQIVLFAALGVILLAIGIGIGAAIGGGGESALVAKSGETTTSDPCPPDELMSDSGCIPIESETTLPTSSTTTTTAAPYRPTPADFQIGIIEVERSCFGSAGCNVTYRIDPKYVGPQSLDPLASYTVIYEVRGGEDLQTKNFSLAGGEATFSEELIQTPPGGVLTAVPLQVLED